MSSSTSFSNSLFKRTASATLAVLLSLSAGVALAQHSDKETQEDIKRHRAMASAHEAAAKCLETKKNHDQCMKDLQTACKGLGIGKYCGMRHAH